MSIARRGVLSVLRRTGTDSIIGQSIIKAACRRAGTKVDVTDDTITVKKDRRGIRLRRAQLILAPAVADDFDNIWAAVEPLNDASTLLDFSLPGEKLYRPLNRPLLFNGFPDLIEPDDDYLRNAQIAPGATCFDLGANVGVVSIALSSRVGPSGKVIALEPDPGNADALEANVSSLDGGPVTVVRAAVATSSGSGSFVAEGGVTSHLQALHGDTVLRESAGTTITCRMVTIEELIAEFGVPAFAKIDIEGFEVPVLETSAKRLFELGVDLALDTHHPFGSGFTKDPVEKVLTSAGYAVESEQVHGAWMTWATTRGPLNQEAASS